MKKARYYFVSSDFRVFVVERGFCMPLQPNEVTTDKIANSAVTTPKIGDLQVTSAKIADGAVTTTKIANASVTRDKIGEKQVSSSRLKDAAVATEKIATGAVITSKIGDAQVTDAKLKDGAVTTPKIGPLQVTSAKLQDGAVTTAKLAGNAVTGAKIASGAVGSPQMASNAVTTDKIANGAITQAKLSFTPPSIARPITPGVAADEIADASVIGQKIANAAVTAPKLAADAVETAKIKDGAVTPAKLSFTPLTRPISPQIENAEIAGDAVTADKIANNAITNGKIADRAVDWVKIALNSINHELLYNIALPTDGQILSFDAASGKFNWIAPPTGGGGMQLTLLPSQPLVFSENSMADVDQLVDLSAVIPATAQAVLLEMQLNAMSVPVGMEQILTVLGRRTGTDFGSSTIHFIWQNMANLNQNAYKEATLAVDTLRQLRVMITKSGVFTSTNIWVKGYIE